MRPWIAAILVAGLASLAPAGAGTPRRSSVREEVTVERVQVDAIVLPRGEDPGACRELEPDDLRALVGGEEWTVEAIDWEGAGVREYRSVDVEDMPLQLAVYVGRFTWDATYVCPWDHDVRQDSSYTPPAAYNENFQHDAFEAARRIARGLAADDRVAFWVDVNGHAAHTRWVRGPAEALRVLDDVEAVSIGDPVDSPDVLETPGISDWTDLVPALGAVRGAKDLVVIGGMDERVFRRGGDPWTLATLAEAARRARVTIHRVSLAPGGRVYLPGTAETLATGGVLFRGGARSRVAEVIRRRAWCRARVTLVPPPGTRRRPLRTVALEDLSGRFELAGTAWLVEEPPPEGGRTLAEWLGAGSGDLFLEVEVTGIRDCVAGEERGSFRCEAVLSVRPSGGVPVEPAIAGVGLWRGSVGEFSRVYRLDAGGPVEAPRRLRLEFTSGEGRRTFCAVLFDREGTYLGSTCRGVVVPPVTDTARAR